MRAEACRIPGTVLPLDVQAVDDGSYDQYPGWSVQNSFSLHDKNILVLFPLPPKKGTQKIPTMKTNVFRLKGSI